MWLCGLVLQYICYVTAIAIILHNMLFWKFKGSFDTLFVIFLTVCQCKWLTNDSGCCGNEWLLLYLAQLFLRSVSAVAVLMECSRRRLIFSPRPGHSRPLSLPVWNSLCWLVLTLTRPGNSNHTGRLMNHSLLLAYCAEKYTVHRLYLTHNDGPFALKHICGSFLQS